MKINKTLQSILLSILVLIHFFLNWYISDYIIDSKIKFLLRLISISLPVFALLILLYIKEKSTDKPNYKILFYFLLITSIFIYLNTFLRK